MPGDSTSSSCLTDDDTNAINPNNNMNNNNMNNNNNPTLMAHAIVLSESVFRVCSESSLVATPVAFIHKSLAGLGVPENEFPSPVTVFRVTFVIVVTLVVYYLCLGKQHMQNRKALKKELKTAQSRVRSLQIKLNALDQAEDERQLVDNPPKEIRIFMDGAFDLLHYGHMNAFRLAKSLGTHLVVGVNSDASITQCKGAPLMTDPERLAMVQQCKFVDEVVEDCPYVMSPEYLEWVIKEYKIDYVVHGSDPCYTLDGEDVYASAKASGKFRTIPRTEGVSTSDILGRILLMTKDHHIYNPTADADDTANEEDDDEGEYSSMTLLGHKSKFLTTSLLLKSFSAGVKAPKSDAKIIYIDGTWDLFHPGHLAVLKAARERGDYLIVGIHGDAIVNRLRGMNMPLMNLHERVLSVLGCQYVDDILIDAPYEITPEMISRLHISEVVCGTKHDELGVPYAENMYDYPKRAGILKVMESPSDFNFSNIVHRIRKNQKTFEAKFERKMKVESEFYEQLHNTTTSQ